MGWAVVVLSLSLLCPNFLGSFLWVLTLGSVRCQSTSCHGTRCCFLAQPYLNHIKKKTQLRTDMPRRQMKRTETTEDKNDALTLLRLQQHVLKLTAAKAALEGVQTLVHETPLSNFQRKFRGRNFRVTDF